MIGVELPVGVAVQGALVGMMYGLLAVGLVLVYRANRIVNFAHGELGAFGAALFALMVGRWGLPYWPTLPIALAASGVVAALAELGVVRRLRGVPPLLTVVATLGLGQFLLLAAATINPDAATGSEFPVPPWMPTFDVGVFRIGPAYSAMLVLAPFAVGALSVFLVRGRRGRALRAAAANPEEALLVGVPAPRMSTLAWGLAGALAALTAILVSPTRGFVAASAFGPSLLLRALVPAVVARMEKLGTAFAAGIGLGVAEQLILWNTTAAGMVELVLLAVVVAGLLLLRPLGQRRFERANWLAIRPWRPTPAVLRDLPMVRRLGPITGAVTAVAAAVAITAMTNATAVTAVAVIGFAVVGLSVTITSGLLGELSLGMFAIGGVGAVVSVEVATATGNFLLAFAGAAFASGLLTVVLGLPSMRAPGLALTVTTLAFALTAQLWLFGQSWAFGRGEEPGQPVIGALRIDTGRRYALFSLVVLVVAVVAARNIGRSPLARRWVAVRDNEPGARAFAVPVVAAKAQGLIVGGAFAGLGGALYAHSLPTVSSAAFPIRSNIDVVAIAALGVIGLIVGPILGAAYVIGVPRFLPLDSAGLAATTLGWLLLLLYVPGGIAQLVAPLRRAVLTRVARRNGIDPDVLDAGAPVVDPTAERPRLPIVPPGERVPDGAPVLVAHGLHKRFGGVTAVERVDLVIPSGSIVGLIGANGAGKTTVFELLAGFTRPDAGRVELRGVDIGGWSPQRRARAGLVRSFQDAALFPSLTVAETVELALDRRHRTPPLLAALGVDRHRRRRRAEADETIAAMGLTPWRDIAVGELSTGTRRITELACLVALRPAVLLLDEPAAGLAQREVEAMGSLLRRLCEEGGTTLVVIEHDIPLVMSISDHVIAMGSGQVIASGEPDAVRRHPDVVASYLGTDSVAVERSGSGGA